MTIDGTKLTQCFEVIAKCGYELEGLRTTLSQLFVEYNAFGWSGEHSDESRFDESGWVYQDYIWGLRVGAKVNSRDKMILGFQIGMMGDTIKITQDASCEPLLHVFFWPEGWLMGFDNGGHMAYPIERTGELKLAEDRLIVWSDEAERPTWLKDSRFWTFSLKLATLTSKEDLFNRVIQPALDLINGKEVLHALPNDLEGLMIYQKDYLELHGIDE